MTGRAVLVAGAGSWGTALAIVLSQNRHRVILWDKITTHINQIKKDRINRKYLPGIKLDKLITAESDFHIALEQSEEIVIVVPSHGLREVLSQLPQEDSHNKICIASKGLEVGTQKFAHQIFDECRGNEPKPAFLSGPSFAKEVAEGLPTAVTISSSDLDIANHFAGLFHNEKFRVYTHNDVIGAEVGGAIKNVMAIAAGIADGLGFGANTRAALITRGLTEIIRLGEALGAQRETFMGLAGLGDLVLTCTDDLSRNRRLGLALASGKTVAQASEAIGQEIEGIQTSREIVKLAERLHIEMPISTEVYNVISGLSTPEQAVKMLLSRDQKAENN